MRRITIPVVLVLMSLSVPACTVGSGEVTTEARSVADFDRVELQGSGQVRITVDGTESLTVEAEDNLISELTSEVAGSTLVLGVRQPIQPTEDIVYTLTMASLEGLEISGSGGITVSEFATVALDLDVTGSGEIAVSGVSSDRISVRITGSGTISIAGSTEALAVSIGGSGSFDGDDLSASTGDITISGSGDATVDVRERLDVDVTGSGSVEYLGDPGTISVNTTGSGSVSRR